MRCRRRGLCCRAFRTRRRCIWWAGRCATCSSGGSPLDLDLVVEGDAAAFASSLGGELKVHDRFGTSTVTLDGFSYDIARARRETYAHPGALPDVAPAPLAEDLERRDFTVNALALALAGDRAGELTSVPTALEDLDARRLRVLHDRSFIDDPTRLFRLVRYATRLGFEIEPHTRALVDRAIADGALGTVSGPRVGAELRLLAREPDPVARARPVWASSGSTARSTPGSASRTRTSPGARSRSLPEDARRDRLALAAAARGVPAPELSPLLDSLAFEAEDRDAIVAAATRADDVAHALRRGARAVGDRDRGGRGAGGAGRARRRARPRGAGPRVARARCATCSSRSTATI